MTITVPDRFLPLLNESSSAFEEAVQVRLAAHFYSIGKISIGVAADLAGMKRWEFEAWLRKEGIDMPWTQDDLRQELAWVGKSV